MSEATSLLLAGNNISPDELRRKIYNEIEGTSVACFALDRSYVRIGVLIAEFKARECWRSWSKEYTTFDDFIGELKLRFKIGRTQLYGYVAVAEVLLPTIGAEKLEQMGVSKALELKRAVKKLEGKPLPPALLDAALDATKTTKELRGTIGQALNLTEEPKGTWLDLDGFFITAEERGEFKKAFLATEALLGLTRDIPDHIRRKEVILTWMREWYGTHAVEVNGAKQPANADPILVPRIQKDVDGFTSSIPKDVDGYNQETSCPYSACETICDCLPERQVL